MSHENCIRVFDSQGEDYKKAFQVFLDHTDQKRNAKRWLKQVVDELPQRKVFIDAGAGNGEITRLLAGSFERTIAIEPNAHLLNQLRRGIPFAETLGEPIMSAEPAAKGDLVLSSHTFYYIDAAHWLDNLERLVSWMSPGGVTIVVLQNRETGCMNMVNRFFGHRFELAQLADAFRTKHGDRYDVVTTLDPAHVETLDSDSAFIVAEFILNLLPIRRAPSKDAVQAYIDRHFRQPEGGYRFPVHQDFLQIRARQD
jgi:trans-aconitate methyltransferase